MVLQVGWTSLSLRKVGGDALVGAKSPGLPLADVNGSAFRSAV